MPEATLRPYDRLLSSLEGRPDTARSRATTVRDIPPIGGNVETYIVQTFRSKEDGDFIFIEHSGPDGWERYHLPPKVVRVLNRQSDQLETQIRRRVGRDLAQKRKDAGVTPFVKKGAR